MAGGPETFPAFEELTAVLFGLTVLREGGMVRLAYGPTGRDRAALGGAGGPTDPLPLNDGRFLRLSVSLYLATDDERGRLLRVDKSSYQYQADQAGKRWIFRYDYLREPGPDPHPQAHLQIRGALTEGAALPRDRTLARIHFPTGRVSIESVIRLLADQFDVACNERPETWRPVLAEAERTFLEIAHRPLSGPSG
jgi:hypothetical protein